jgi:hypothetical protein
MPRRVRNTLNREQPTVQSLVHTTENGLMHARKGWRARGANQGDGKSGRRRMEHALNPFFKGFLWPEFRWKAGLLRVVLSTTTTFTKDKSNHAAPRSEHSDEQGARERKTTAAFTVGCRRTARQRCSPGSHPEAVVQEQLGRGTARRRHQLQRGSESHQHSTTPQTSRSRHQRRQPSFQERL